MPLYSTRCKTCGDVSTVKLTFSHYDAVKLGTKVLECGICRGTAALEFNPGDVNFVLKDGESGGWASKALKENKYRAKRQGVMERRQRDHAPNPKLVPNFAGEQLSSWSEARAAAYETAYEETRDATAAKEAASTYDPLVQRENAK